MNALIRYLRQGADGVPEVQDTEAHVEDIDVGSAADRTIQLLGREIAAKHAKITASGAKVRITALAGRRVRVNAREVSSAALAIGDSIEIGGHRLRLVAPPPGFDLAVEVQLNPAADASAFESAFRTDLEQTWLSRRGGAWLLGTLTLVLAFAIPLATVFMHREGLATPPGLPDDVFWSPGPLIPAHEQAISEHAALVAAAGLKGPAHPNVGAQRCSACHEQLFVPVRDPACRTCHERVLAHVTPEDLALTPLGPPQRCAQCHREHDGGASLLAVKDDSLCVSCHRDSHTRFGSLKIEPVSGFEPGGRHPGFSITLFKPPPTDPADRAPAPAPAAPASASGGTSGGTSLCDESSDDALRNSLADWLPSREPVTSAHEQSNLKFSHARHLDAAHVTRTRDGAALGCADCHTPELDGEHFVPVTMARSCGTGGCHQLTFDRFAPQLPHGRPCEAMFVIEDYFSRKLTDPTLASARRIPARRLPDRESVTDGAAEICKDATYVCANKKANAEIERQFSPAGSGCVSCHGVNDYHTADIHERFQVVPVRLTYDYFAKARFDHRAHARMKDLTGDAACESCHKARASKQSSDVLIPDIDNCLECHSDRPKLDHIAVQCVSCHAYHPAAIMQANRGAK